jgi:uroporphyrinogen-III decarboxylase
MNSLERVEAAIALDVPDRVPLSPLLDHWAATYTGISNAELMSDPEKRIKAVLKTASDFKWDMTYIADTANADILRLGVPARLLIPGRDLPPDEVHQFDEKEVMNAEDYAFLENEGVIPFLERIMSRIYPGMSMAESLSELAELGSVMADHSSRIRRAGMEPAVGFVLVGPAMEMLSFTRGISNALIDLRRYPGEVKAATKLMREFFLPMAVDIAKANNVPRVFLGCSRCSPAFVSPKLFEEFILPDIMAYIHVFAEAGVTPWLHMDTDWTRYLHYFRSLPKGKCVLELDGATDIFEAKKVLGDVAVLKGDVPAALTSMGTRDEVMAYCRRLIEEVGKGGGFILGSGCSIPANAKTENIAAMTDAVFEWGGY